MSDTQADIGMVQAGQEVAYVVALLLDHVPWLALKPERGELELLKLASAGDHVAQFEYANLMLALVMNGQCQGFEGLAFAMSYAQMAAINDDPKALMLLAILRLARARVMMCAGFHREERNDQTATMIFLDQAAQLGDRHAEGFTLDTARVLHPESVLAAREYQRNHGVH